MADTKFEAKYVFQGKNVPSEPSPYKIAGPALDQIVAALQSGESAIEGNQLIPSPQPVAEIVFRCFILHVLKAGKSSPKSVTG